MKRIIVWLLIGALFFSLSVSASATSTTLTIDVPEPSYTLNVPATQSIAYRASEASIGGVTISNMSGFSSAQEVWVKINYSGEFTTPQYATAIRYSLKCKGNGSDTRYDLSSGSSIKFTSDSDGTLNTYPTLADGSPADEFIVVIDTSCWETALGGKYTTTITYDAGVYANSGT